MHWTFSTLGYLVPSWRQTIRVLNGLVKCTLLLTCTMLTITVMATIARYNMLLLMTDIVPEILASWKGFHLFREGSCPMPFATTQTWQQPAQSAPPLPLPLHDGSARAQWWNVWTDIAPMLTQVFIAAGGQHHLRHLIPFAMLR